ncbi:HlyD family secretion protein [Clostridium minihomine]|uniref:HlyD family secretion protein n=1 Tax=Clostridium minihomine TaxID=2045012 RepID=UPI000C7776EA|nr:HlyD family efflux transporter periplasmic adaptor subunit [Clostridium minihomine]
MKKKKYLSAALAAAVMLTALTGCNNSTQDSGSSQAPQKTAQSDDIVVWGEVKYKDEYQINIDFPSKVTSVEVKEGDLVSKGQVLIGLTTSDYQADLKKLQTQVDSSKGTLNQVDQEALKSEISVLKKQIGYKTTELQNGTKPELQLLQSSLTRATKEVNDAQKDVDKYQGLYDSGVISQAELEKYQDVLNVKQKAKSDVQENIAKTKRMLQEELDTLNSTLKYKQTELNQQQNTTDSAQIDLKVLTDKMKKPYLSENNIVSNLDSGIVKEINVVTGASVGIQYAPQKVISLIDRGSIYVSAEVPEEFISRISVNSKVTIIPTANQEIKIKGTITQISNTAVEKDGARIVKVQVKPDDSGNVLKPGFTADVKISRTSESASSK